MNTTVISITRFFQGVGRTFPTKFFTFHYKTLSIPLEMTIILLNYRFLTDQKLKFSRGLRPLLTLPSTKLLPKQKNS